MDDDILPGDITADEATKLALAGGVINSTMTGEFAVCRLEQPNIIHRALSEHFDSAFFHTPRDAYDFFWPCFHKYMAGRSN